MAPASCGISGQAGLRAHYVALTACLCMAVHSQDLQRDFLSCRAAGWPHNARHSRNSFEHSWDSGSHGVIFYDFNNNKLSSATSSRSGASQMRTLPVSGCPPLSAAAEHAMYGHGGSSGNNNSSSGGSAGGTDTSPLDMLQALASTLGGSNSSGSGSGSGSNQQDWSQGGGGNPLMLALAAMENSSNNNNNNNNSSM
eukprot:2713-Heterococcus_DN1.PRE.3